MSTLLQHIERYITLTEVEKNIVLFHTKPLSIKKKELLLQQGQVCKSMHFIEQGCLCMYFVNDKGLEQITQFAIENWWMADYMSFTTQTPSNFYIRAVENTQVLALSQESQEELLLQVPKMERYFRLVTQRAYAATQIRLKHLHDLSKEESYHHFCSHFPEFVQRIPQYMLASYLGFSPEYLSEIRKKKS